MGVLKEYTCLGHGDFESSDDDPTCPSGCTCIERRFRTPAVFRSGRTKNIDRTFESLAKSHNLTDLGPGAMRRKALAAEKSQEAYKEFCEKRFGGIGWSGVAKGGNLNVQTGQIKGEGPGATAAVAHAGASGSVSNEQVHELVPKQMPVQIRRDPQNLTLADAKAA